MANQIRAAAFMRTLDWTLLRIDCFEKGKQVNKDLNKCIYKKAYEDDIELIIKKIQSTGTRPEERNKLQTGNGLWCFKLDDQNVCYMVLNSNEYPERQSFAMIKEMEKELKKLDCYSTLNPKDVSIFIKGFIKDLQDKYNNLTRIDKLSQAQNQIEDVRLIMEKNVQDMIQNHSQVDQLDGKADKMRLDAKQFQVQATDLARIMYWRNFKLKIAIFVIILSIILYISVPLIITATAAKNATSSNESSTTNNPQQTNSNQSSPTTIQSIQNQTNAITNVSSVAQNGTRILMNQQIY